MLRSVRCVLVMALVFGIGGCVSDQTKKGNQGGASGQGGGSGRGGGSGQGGGAPTGGAAGSAPDAMAAAPTTCREIRVCIFNCADDKGCASRCVSTAPAAARQKYDEAHTCILSACPDQDEDCRCNQECFAGGTCTDLVDTCDDAVSDPLCDVKCH
jgi:hypothetical protein